MPINPTKLELCWSITETRDLAKHLYGQSIHTEQQELSDSPRVGLELREDCVGPKRREGSLYDRERGVDAERVADESKPGDRLAYAEARYESVSRCTGQFWSFAGRRNEGRLVLARVVTCVT